MKIYSKGGALLLDVLTTDKCERKHVLQGDNYVQVVFSSTESKYLPIDSYILEAGEEFSLLVDYQPVDKNGVYEYSAKFYSRAAHLVKPLFYYKPKEGAKEYDFKISANLPTIAGLILTALTAEDPGGNWSLGSMKANTELKDLTFSGVSIMEAISYVAAQFETEWWTYRGKLNFIKNEVGAEITIDAKTMLSSSSQQEKKDIPPSRVYAYGGTKNMPSVSSIDVIYSNRLQLPEGIEYVDIPGMNTGASTVKFFDAIYPKIEGVITEVVYNNDDKSPVYYVNDAARGFDLAEQTIKGLIPRIRFISGRLNGRDFDVQDLIKAVGEAPIGYMEIFREEQEGIFLPRPSLEPQVGDKYMLYNINLPESKRKEASARLLAAAIDWAETQAYAIAPVTCETNRVYFSLNPPLLEVGARVKLVRPDLPGGFLSSRVTEISYPLNERGDIKFTLSQIASSGKLSSIERSISAINSVIGGNEMAYHPLKGSPMLPLSASDISVVSKALFGAFSEGVFGSGAAITIDPETGVSRFEVDELFVRMRAVFTELVVDKLSHVGGELIMSPARCQCLKVEDMEDFYRCYFEGEQQFVAGDQAQARVFTGAGTKFYWRLVVGVGEGYIDLSKTDAIAGSDIPTAEDAIMQFGNRTDTTRQSVQVLSTYGADSPSYKQYGGIDSYSLVDKELTVLSRTKNKITGEIIFESGKNAETEVAGAVKAAMDAEKSAIAAEKKAAEADKKAAEAGDRLNMWASDSVISPTEKLALKQEAKALLAEKDSIISDALKYGVDKGAYQIAYDAYSNELIYHSSAKPENIDIRPAFITSQTEYYAAQKAVLDAIATAAKKVADDADKKAGQAIKDAAAAAEAAAAADGKATAAGNRLTAWASDAVISPTEKLALKQEAAALAAEKESIVSDAAKYGVTSIPYSTAYTKYNTELTYHSTSEPENITVRPEFATSQVAYYTAQKAILNAIVAAAKKVADDAAAMASESKNFIDNVLPKSLEGLQSQIDGQQESFFESYDPALSNYPASGWTTSEIKERHLNDTFTNNSSGRSWRWTKNETSYYWVEIADTATVEALRLAGLAKDTADGKRRVFTAQPTTPYDIGDLWSQGSAGELMVCKVARLTGAYTSSDWGRASKYTDDTEATKAAAAAAAALVAAEKGIKDAATANKSVADISDDNIVTPSEKPSILKEWQIIRSEYTLITTQSILFGVSSVSYDAAYTSLSGVIGTNLDNLTTNWNVSGASLRGAFKNYYDERTKLQGLFVTGAKNTADEAKAKTDNFTTITGGLIVSSMLTLGETINGTFKVQAGMTGIGSNSQDILAWYGGERKEIGENHAQIVFRRDGSGYLANNNLWWDAAGNISSKFNTIFIGDEDIKKFLNSVKSDIEKVDKKVDDMFTLQTINGVKVIRMNYSAYTDYGLTCLGYDPITGGGGGSDYNRLDTWESYTDDKAEYVLSAGLGWGLKNRIVALENGGALSSVTVKLGDIAYNSVNGVVSLPAYPVTDLSNYVTLNTAQNITGVKTFYGIGVYASNEFNHCYNFAGGGLWVNYRGSNAAITEYYMGAGTGTTRYANVRANGFVKDGGTAAQLLRADGGISNFNFIAQVGQPAWVWGSNSDAFSNFVWNPSNFDVNSATFLSRSFNVDNPSDAFPIAYGINHWAAWDGLTNAGKINGGGYNVGISVGGVDSTKYGFQLGFSSGMSADVYCQTFTLNTAHGWNRILHSGNWSSIVDGRYLPLTGGTLTGRLTINLDNPFVRFKQVGTEIGEVGATSAGVYLWNTNRNNYLEYLNSGELRFERNKVWHAGNDGAGSGLDADLLDGVHYRNILERLYTLEFPQVNSTAWYRVGEFIGYNSISPSAIIMIGTTYTAPQNGGYVYSITVGYYGDMNVSQLSGAKGGNVISNVRLDYTNSGKCYFDIQCNYDAHINTIHVTAIGAFAVYESPIINPATVGSQVAYTTYAGAYNNVGYTAPSFSGAFNGNSSSATKLATPRSIWGQSFDGTANVSGSLTSVSTIDASSRITAADFYTGGVYRSVGDVGWYNETYGGGWRMTDRYYIRAYGDKCILTANDSYDSFNSSGGYFSSRDTSRSDSWSNCLEPYNHVFNLASIYVSGGTVHNVLGWADTISGVGYTTRYSIASARSSSGWGGIQLSVGDNDAGTSGRMLQLNGNGHMYWTGSFSTDSTISAPSFSGSFSGNLNGVAAYANRLQYARTIWGKSFDGFDNVRGALTEATTIDASGRITGNDFLVTGGWFRSTGQVGWYSETYGGGIRMLDTPYIRTYGGKGFRVEDGAVISAGEHLDDAYGIINVARTSSINNASCFSWVRNGVAAFALGFNISNEIVLGGGNRDKTVTPWLRIGSSTMTYSGNFLATGGITCLSDASDERLKDYIQEFDAKTIINTLLPKAYKWNGIAKNRGEVFQSDNWQFGLIYQDVCRNNYISECAVHNAFGDGYGSVKMERIIPILIQGEKQLYSEVDLLKMKVEVLEKRIKQLEEC